VSALLHPGRRVTGAGLIVGLLAAAVAALALVETSSAPPAVRTPGSAARSAPTTDVTAAAARAGLRLLRLAAVASAAVPYSGEQVVAWWGPGGVSTSVIQVWHPPHGSVLTHVANVGAAPSAGSSVATTAGGQDPDGILGMTVQMLSLIRAHYAVAAAGRGMADGRPARVVELHRADGTLAARFWLDSATGLPLRRETFDARARMVSEDAFIDLQIGASALRGMPAPAVQPWSAALSQAQISRLRADGWLAPKALPDGLVLIAAHQADTTAGTVVDLDYSDGLSVVSVFVQRGNLPAAMAGWQEIEVNGHEVYTSDPSQQSLAWSARGFVYTVIAEAPATTVSEVVAVMPHDNRPGFWRRISRGMHRLASWANPFR
jgi:sigma-E factor negative regulatory protein RseB